MEKKNIYIAMILGLIFGPFGYLYFGIMVFISTLIIQFIALFICAFITPYVFNGPGKIIYQFIFSINGYFLTMYYNKAILSFDDNNFSYSGYKILRKTFDKMLSLTTSIIIFKWITISFIIIECIHNIINYIKYNDLSKTILYILVIPFAFFSGNYILNLIRDFLFGCIIGSFTINMKKGGFLF